MSVSSFARSSARRVTRASIVRNTSARSGSPSASSSRVAGATESSRAVTAFLREGTMRYQTHVPRRSEARSPASFNTFRWCETVGWDTSVSSARSHTQDSPRGSVAIAESIRSRSGSANALSVLATAMAASAPIACSTLGVQFSASSTGQSWSCCPRFVRVGIPFEPGSRQPERDIDESNKHRHLDERADDPCECLPRGSAKGADGDRDGELKVVAGRGESERRRASISEPDRFADDHADEPHDGEVGEERYGDARNIERVLGDGLALEREQQHDSEEQ